MSREPYETDERLPPMPPLGLTGDPRGLWHLARLALRAAPVSAT